MNGKKLVSLLLAAVLLVALFAGCSNNNTPTDNTTNNAATTSGEREYYKFSHYWSYDWWGAIHPWGEDAASAWWKEKFNIDMDQSKPDGQTDEVLNLMITSDNLPDSIMMDRGANNIKMARMGLLVDLDTLKPMISGNYYDDNILKQTQELLKVDGKLYNIPNWARKDASGGNNCWLYTQGIYEQAGSPSLKTLEDLYAYACSVRDNVKKNNYGVDTIPFSVKDSADATMTVIPFYRSMGGPTLAETTFYGRVGSSYQFVYRDPIYRAAVMEANKWFREGLLAPTVFTNNGDQWQEQLTNARVGLIWYDFSQDDGNNFRKIVRQTFPGDSIEIVTAESNGNTYLYLPANGLSYDRIYGDHDGTIGWNITCITKKAKKPERIFELWSHFLTKEGSINMMYGPQGELWDELDSNGNPILKQSPDSLPVTEVERLGLWWWPYPGHSDNVDSTKFAVNDALPEGERNWVVSAQAHIFTPLKRPLTDEYTNIGDAIEPATDLAVKRTLCEDYLKAQLPKIVMAATPEEAERLYDEAIAWVDSNGMPEIEATYDAKYQANCRIQGGSIFTR